MTAPGEDLVGRTVLGRYRVVLPLGRGGQGMVYLARGEGAAGFARPVVVKRVLTPYVTDNQVLDQFAREARITAQLRHPAIVPVLDFERDRGSYVMVLEYVHGYDLRRWERFVHKTRERMPADIVAYVVARVLEALHYAHTLRASDGSPRQVIHRDVSPANVLIDVDGHVKLTDFGIARMDAEEITVVTSGTQIKGKLPYVAPELFRGAQPSVASDVYACGVMLHELLRGANEFRSQNAMESLTLANDHIPTRVDVLRPDVSQAYADVVAKALAKDPAERFESALDFASALRGAGRVDEAEVEARFKETVRDDFFNPELPKYVGALPLAELDSAWRAAEEASVRLKRQKSAEMSVAAAHHSDPPNYPPATGPALIEGVPRWDAHDELMPRALRPSTWAVGVAVLSLLIVVAGLSMSKNSVRPKVVYVERETVADEATTASVPEPPPALRPPPAEAARELTAARSEAPGPAHEHDLAARVSAAFAQKRSSVERCFGQHASDVESPNSVQVQFAVDPSGRVTSASLVPEALTGTPFGRCVVEAAMDTHFGQQPKPLAFRIPITARVVP